MQIERFSTHQGEYIQLSFIKWEEYSNLILNLKKYIDILKENNQPTEIIEKIINSISTNRKSTQEYAVVTKIMPGLYFDFFSVMYDAILKINENINYKELYEESMSICKALKSELVDLTNEYNKSYKEQEYEIKKLKSEIKTHSE